MLPWKMPPGCYTVILTQHAGDTFDITTTQLNDRGEKIYQYQEDNVSYQDGLRVRRKLGRCNLILSGSCSVWFIHV